MTIYADQVGWSGRVERGRGRVGRGGVGKGRKDQVVLEWSGLYGSLVYGKTVLTFRIRTMADDQVDLEWSQDEQTFFTDEV